MKALVDCHPARASLEWSILWGLASHRSGAGSEDLRRGGRESCRAKQGDQIQRLETYGSKIETPCATRKSEYRRAAIIRTTEQQIAPIGAGKSAVSSVAIDKSLLGI